MAPIKFVIKSSMPLSNLWLPFLFVLQCGNFAVLVDLHVLPPGGQEDASWFTTDHIEEVTALVRDSVDQRVKQHTELLHSRRHHKQKMELAPASALFVKGRNFSVVANFLKRHINLRCIAKQLQGDLRVFPERYVVCVSCPEDASAHHGNLSLAATEQSEQSRSEYFSRVGETQELLNSSMKTKKTALQKIAKQASVQQEQCGSNMSEQQTDPRDCVKKQAVEQNQSPKEIVSSSAQTDLLETDHKGLFPTTLNEAHVISPEKQLLTQNQQAENSPSDCLSPNGASLDICIFEISQGNGKRCKPSDIGEDPDPQKAKRTCLGRPPATIGTRSAECSTQTSKSDYQPLTPLPPEETKTESKAFPVSELKKTTLEVELLTLGKRAQRLPLTSNNTAQTNQNRLATSLRGLSVKPVSSGPSISSRSTLGEEGSENVPRTSRLRRLKRS